MRALSAGESAVLDASQYRVSWRVRTKNGSGTLIDLSSHKGINWHEHLTYTEDIDELVSQAVIELKRDVERPGGGYDANLSMSPLRTDSALNRLNDGLTFSPLIDVGREIHVDVAVTESWRAPETADWKPLLKGFIDDIQLERDPIRVIALDEGAVLVDRWIEAEAQYGTLAGVAMETVMQSILDDTLGAGVVTLYVPVSPSFAIVPYVQRQEPILHALRALADLKGWDVRYRWHAGTSAFRLTLQEPPRAKTTPDRTFGPSRVLAVSKLKLDRANIRNAVTVIYGPGTPKPRPSEVRTDATSISRFGRRWMGIEEASDSSINSSSEAGDLADVALSDLKDPKADQEMETMFFWPTEVWDLYRFSANAIHYNADQDWAVVSVRHELSMDRHRTYIQTRGAVAGHYLLWYKKMTGMGIMGIDYPERRGGSRGRDAFNGDGVVESNLAEGVKQYSGGTTIRKITKGHIGGTGKNGDVITFSENFQATPIIVVEGGLTYEPRTGQWSGSYNAALPQSFQREGVNVSVSGFTLRGRLMQKGTATARTHNFPASNDLDTIGETTELTLSNAPSSNDQYTVNFSVSLSVTNLGPGIGSTSDAYLEVAVDTMTDGVSWVQRAQRPFHETDVFGGGATTLTVPVEPVIISVTGVDSSDKVRIRIVSLVVFNDPGSSGSSTFSVHGFDGTADPDSGVTYTTATDIFATMTPDTPDLLIWHAMEVDS